MKKLSLAASNLKKGEMLTREQMKKVLGAIGSAHNCHLSYENRSCSFNEPGFGYVEGYCNDINGQCMCVASNGVSTPQNACVK